MKHIIISIVTFLIVGRGVMWGVNEVWDWLPNGWFGGPMELIISLAGLPIVLTIIIVVSKKIVDWIEE